MPQVSSHSWTFLSAFLLASSAGLYFCMNFKLSVSGFKFKLNTSAKSFYYIF